MISRHFSKYHLMKVKRDKIKKEDNSRTHRVLWGPEFYMKPSQRFRILAALMQYLQSMGVDPHVLDLTVFSQFSHL